MVFFGMKFDECVLKSKRVSQVLSTGDHKYHLLNKNLFRGNYLIQKWLYVIESQNPLSWKRPLRAFRNFVL